MCLRPIRKFFITRLACKVEVGICIIFLVKHLKWYESFSPSLLSCIFIAVRRVCVVVELLGEEVWAMHFFDPRYCILDRTILFSVFLRHEYSHESKKTIYVNFYKLFADTKS